MSRESNSGIIGGISRQTRRSRKMESVPPPQVGIRFLIPIVLICAVFAGLGYWRIHTVFTIRDYEMETNRKQQAMRIERDRAKVMEARVSELGRVETLRTYAEERFGMTTPDPAEIESVEISPAAIARWEEAARAANQLTLEGGG